MNDSVELLAPAGDEKNFYAAVNNGANAVYLGLGNFSARKNAGNFAIENLSFFTAYAHALGVKVYVAINTLIKNCELNDLFSLVKKALDCGADAFIVQDVFLGRTLKKLFPSIVLHLSTQAGVCNTDGAKLAAAYGFSRVILARETPISEITEICKIIETEVFIHGALCTCFSGHCYFSSFVGGNSGNRGLCRQPCRKLYKYGGVGVKDEMRYALSLADLNLSKRINELKSVGVKSFKIEGRMRSFEYVCAACEFYSELLSDNNYNAEKAERLKRAYNRGDYTEGLCFGQKSGLISDKIQNHSGSKIGTVTAVNAKNLKISFNKYKPNEGDCYKIIFGGKETGNAIAVSSSIARKTNSGSLTDSDISISYKGFAPLGASLNITKDVSLLKKYESAPKKTIEVSALLTAEVGEKMRLEVNGNVFYSDYVVQSAINCVTSKNEIKENLRKVDVYPFCVEARAQTSGNIFIPKKAINELRSRAYREYFYSFSQNVKTSKIDCNERDFKNFYDLSELKNESKLLNKSNAVILRDEYPLSAFKGVNFLPSHVIYCPSDYNDEITRDKFLQTAKQHLQSLNNSSELKAFLYVPPYFTKEDEKIIAKLAEPFYGLYVEAPNGIYLAKRLKKQTFGGIELNVTNSLTANALKSEGLLAYSASKELSYSELASFDGFKLALGDVKVMSLIYCPFNKKCSDCKRGDLLYLEDAEKRKFKVRRYKLSSCRFEIYNESELKSKIRLGKEIYDFSASGSNEIYSMLTDYLVGEKTNVSASVAAQKSGKTCTKIKYTSGNLQSGMN